MSLGPTDTLPSKDPLTGTRLGEYEVLEPIGYGGMGVVYRGLHPVIKKQVAIKVLKPEYAQDAAQVARLTGEAEAVNAIRHRNIIDIFSLGRLPDGRPYIVMELLDGEPLDSHLRARGKLPLDEALRLLSELCIPLQAAHRANVVHRDLKPSNIFLCQGADSERYLKLLDFGLAKRIANFDGSTAQTSQATITGTPSYIAPEQARGRAVSPRTDIYALGVIAFEMLTGRLPYPGDDPLDVVLKHVSAPVPSARELAPELPEVLDRLIIKMMAKAPEDRVPSVEQVKDVLEQVRRLGPVAPRRSKVVAPFVFVAAGLVAAALAIAANIALQPSADAPPAQQLVAPPPPLPSPPALAVERPEAPPEQPENPIAPDKPTPPRLPAKREAPTAAALLERVKALEHSLRQRTPPGEDPDPSALTLLSKYRAEANLASSEAERLKVGKTLDRFERTFLKR